MLVIYFNELFELADARDDWFELADARDDYLNSLLMLVMIDLTRWCSWWFIYSLMLVIYLNDWFELADARDDWFQLADARDDWFELADARDDWFELADARDDWFDSLMLVMIDLTRWCSWWFIWLADARNLFEWFIRTL